MTALVNVLGVYVLIGFAAAAAAVLFFFAPAAAVVVVEVVEEEAAERDLFLPEAEAEAAKVGKVDPPISGRAYG